MTGPATPGQEGPSYGPPTLPQGWIAQWDGTSKKYYFVQLSTGKSQWETPTEPAPTAGTPTATPGQDMSPFPQPGQQQIMGERGLDGGPDGERGFGTMAMNSLLHSQGGGGKQSNPLLGLAGQFIGGGKPHQSHQPANAGAAGLVGALAGSFLGGGKKPNEGPQQSYSGQQPQYGQQGGLVGKLGGFLGGQSGGHHNNNFGYSEGGQQQGGYTGQAPPSSYQPAGQQSSPYYNPQQPSQPQHPPDNSSLGATSSIGAQQHQQSTTYGTPSAQPSYGAPPQQPPYGASTQQPAYGVAPQQSNYGATSPQPTYGAPPQQPPQQPSYGATSQQPTYGAPSQQPPQQPSYGATSPQPAYGAPPQQPPYGAAPQQPPYGAPPSQPPYGAPNSQQSYGAPSQGPQQPYPHPSYTGQPPSGNLAQPEHHKFQGLHNASHHGGLYGDGNSQSGAPPHGQGGYGAQGGYNELPGTGRW